MKIKYLTPLVMFLIPTIIASAVMWPPAAMRIELIGGFTIMIFSMSMTYICGIRVVLKDTHHLGLVEEK